MVFKAINEFIFGKKFVNFDEFLSEVKKDWQDRDYDLS